MIKLRPMGYRITAYSYFSPVRSDPYHKSVTAMHLNIRTISSLAILLLIMACGNGGAPTSPATDAIPEDDAVHVNARPETAIPDTGANSAASFPAADQYAGSALTYAIIDAPNGTFGYDILSNGKPFIHQTNLPGQPGNDGCKTKADAEKLAGFVMKKVQGGEMPPSITRDDLKTLGIVR